MSESKPHPVDVHVGQFIRMRRLMLGLTQTCLAEQVDPGGGHISFQQLQKYEMGTSRVSASMLYLIAQALHCSPDMFFEGLPDTATAQEDAKLSGDLSRAMSIITLMPEAVLIPSLPGPALKVLGSLMETIAKNHQSEGLPGNSLGAC
jgi:transcriptional regulator with XRE-family HTH domain